ncbi:peptidoglycan DD-metalloendopeptidase family protein [Janibacter sp. G1551]|uniref:peptidoglycan DD-metalloendopeptidase family protein n=1 Tax=Janibacter sp. G1551 TaxID=3420440 RepID=UPI003D075339
MLAQGTRLSLLRGRAGTGAALALCLALSMGSASAMQSEPDPGQQKQKVDQQLADSQHDLSETSASLVHAYDALKATRAKIPAARARLAKAQSTEAAADAHNAEMAAALAVAEADEARAVKDLAKTNASISSARKRVAGLAAQMYQEQGLGQLSVAMSAQDPSELADRIALSDTVAEVQNQSISALATSKATLTSQESHLRALRDRTAELKDEAQSALDQATAARADAATAKAEVERIESTQTRQASALRDQRSKELNQVAKMQAESDRLGKVLEERARRARIKAAKIAAARAAREAERAAARAAAEQAARDAARDAAQTQSQPRSNPAPDPAPQAPAPPAPAPQSGGYLSVPVNAPVTSEFGYRIHPIYGTARLHAGRDYGAACGTPVRAAAGGVIVSAGVAGGYGNQIVVDHGVQRGVGLATTYNHLQSFAVSGGRVSRGQIIGYVGTTGTSTGCHLHFETRENGIPVDPREWL